MTQIFFSDDIVDISNNAGKIEINRAKSETNSENISTNEGAIDELLSNITTNRAKIEKNYDEIQNLTGKF